MPIKILTGVAVVIGGFLAFVSTTSTQMLVTREITVNAPAEIIFPYINHSKKADDWMPWQSSDPDVKINYSGPEEGVGSKSNWASTGKMGTGEALVIESVANQVVKTQLTYTKPFQMSQLAEIALTPVSGGTKITWSVSGEKNFVCRMMGVFMDMDKMVGGEFEKGLLNLKTRVESKITETNR